MSKRERSIADPESPSFSSAPSSIDDNDVEESLEKTPVEPSISRKQAGLEPLFRKRNGVSTGLRARLLEWLSKSFRTVEKEGATFRKALSPQDVRYLKIARLLFHSCSILPALIYYMGTVERPAKFPATISFTIRKGPPKHAQTLLWVAGWACMGRVIRRAGSQVLQRFCTKMFLTGVWTTQVFRLGKGELSDVAHFGGALVYMLDHTLLFDILNTKPVFRKIFYASFALLVTGIGGTRALEVLTGLPMESDAKTSTADRARLLARVDPKLRRKLFCWELLVMLSENLLFASFVQGIPSGLVDGCEKGQENTEDEDETTKDERKEKFKKSII